MSKLHNFLLHLHTPHSCRALVLILDLAVKVEENDLIVQLARHNKSRIVRLDKSLVLIILAMDVDMPL